MPQNAKNSRRAELSVSKDVSKGNGLNTSLVQPDLNDGQTEEQREAAVLQMGADQWKQQAQEMAK